MDIKQSIIIKKAEIFDLNIQLNTISQIINQKAKELNKLLEEEKNEKTLPEHNKDNGVK